MRQEVEVEELDVALTSQDALVGQEIARPIHLSREPEASMIDRDRVRTDGLEPYPSRVPVAGDILRPRDVARVPTSEELVTVGRPYRRGVGPPALTDAAVKRDTKIAEAITRTVRFFIRATFGEMSMMMTPHAGKRNRPG